MATVLENYRIAVHAIRPNAKLKNLRVQPGILDYQIMDGDEQIGDAQISPTAAWREAGYWLMN